MSKCKSRLQKYVRRNVTKINTKTRSRVQLNDCLRKSKEPHQVKRKPERTPLKTSHSPYKNRYSKSPANKCVNPITTITTYSTTIMHF